jgi:hypothetical protein
MTSDTTDGILACFTAIGACICIPIMLALELAGLALGIADIVIGAKYLHADCHIHDLAVYLIVSGVICIICFLLRCCRKKKAGKDNENPDDSEPSCIEWMFIITHVSILIWGMTLVWGTERGNCPVTLYEYGYYATVVSMFICVAILALAVLYCICSVSVVACCDSDTNTSCVIECGSCMTGKKPKQNTKLQENIRQLTEMTNTLDTVIEISRVNGTAATHVIQDIPRSDSISSSTAC